MNCKVLDLCKELKIEMEPNYPDDIDIALLIGNILKVLMKAHSSQLSLILEFMTDITDVEE